MIAFIKHAEQSRGALRCTAVPLLLSPYLLLRGLIVSVCWFGCYIEVLTPSSPPLSPPLTPSFSSPVFLCRWNKGWFWHPGAWCHYAGSWKRYRWVDSWCVFFFFFPLCVLLFSSAPLTHIATWFKTVCPNLFGSAPLQTKQCQLATSRHRLPKFPVCCKSKDFFFFPSFWDWQCNGLLSMCKTWLYKTTVFQKP